MVRMGRRNLRVSLVQTENVRRFDAAIKGMAMRGAGEATWVLVVGQPGLGKTTCVTDWAARNKAVVLRLSESATPRWVLHELVDGLGLVPRGGCRELTHAALERLGQRPRAIVIDEAENGLVNRCRALEAIRNISDRLEIPVILSGRNNLIAGLQDHPQFLTRVAMQAVAQFEPCNLADVAMLRAAVLECEAEAGIDERILDLSGGYTREIMHVLGLLRPHAMRLPTPRLLTMAAYEAEVKPRRVKILAPAKAVDPNTPALAEASE
jgi:hypothetical protein